LIEPFLSNVNTLEEEEEEEEEERRRKKKEGWRE
jgi:hypothetical protein